MPDIFQRLRRWASAPHVPDTTNRPSSADQADDRDKHIGELPTRPINELTEFRTRFLLAPPARGNSEVTNWLDALNATQDDEVGHQLQQLEIAMLSRLRDQNGEGSRHSGAHGPYTPRILERPYLRHKVPESIAAYSGHWIMQTMFDLYHPLGDRESYFVWFSGAKSQYPSGVGHTNNPGTLYSDGLGPLGTMSLARIIMIERARSRRRRLQPPPYPPPFCHRNTTKPDPPRFWAMDAPLYGKGFPDVDAAVQARQAQEEQDGVLPDPHRMLRLKPMDEALIQQQALPHLCSDNPSDDEGEEVGEWDVELRFQAPAGAEEVLRHLDEGLRASGYDLTARDNGDDSHAG